MKKKKKKKMKMKKKKKKHSRPDKTILLKISQYLQVRADLQVS